MKDQATRSWWFGVCGWLLLPFSVTSEARDCCSVVVCDCVVGLEEARGRERLTLPDWLRETVGWGG